MFMYNEKANKHMVIFSSQHQKSDLNQLQEALPVFKCRAFSFTQIVLLYSEYYD